MQEGFPFKLYLLDEDAFSLAIYEQYFKNMQCSNVRLFDNLAPFVAALCDSPQVVLMDYRTDPAKGLKILTAVKRIIPNAYIVFITGRSGIMESLFSLKEGAFEYMIKEHDHGEQLEQVLQRIYQTELVAIKKP
ncbi:MAG: hypothetical protein RL172_2390 [Bacteroidota bacterium]